MSVRVKDVLKSDLLGPIDSGWRLIHLDIILPFIMRRFLKFIWEHNGAVDSHRETAMSSSEHHETDDQLGQWAKYSGEE
ncbi:hypothetical protein A0H81_10404 [Grifola frondosa]|uniref:Uncharacterized protein n=1 Tax=Grifola frondosa TaxID=5627 RepID=A0A1C7M0T9_GRIFR|nr:hypothetical protein A0H81_10404 [Grifola frondosa]